MDTLYHYCSSSTFASIVNNNSIWLSSLSLSNDYMEGKFVTQTFERLLAQSNISAEEMDTIRRAIQMAEEIFDGLGFCLSKEPDLLSQWRGYADDGQGFSIGFSKTYLEALSKAKNDGEPIFRLCQVIYEPEEHEAALRPTYDQIKGMVESGSLKMLKYGLLTMPDEDTMKKNREDHIESTKQLWYKALSAFRTVYTLKNKAFKEEVEWRLISYLSREFEDSASYRATGNRLVPYRDLPLKDLGQKRISKVYIGPKNITPNHVVEKFLRQCGHPDVEVHRSSATYR